MKNKILNFNITIFIIILLISTVCFAKPVQNKINNKIFRIEFEKDINSILSYLEDIKYDNEEYNNPDIKTNGLIIQIFAMIIELFIVIIGSVFTFFIWAIIYFIQIILSFFGWC